MHSVYECNTKETIERELKKVFVNKEKGIVKLIFYDGQVYELVVVKNGN